MQCDSLINSKTETKLLEFFRLATGELLKKCYGKKQVSFWIMSVQKKTCPLLFPFFCQRKRSHPQDGKGRQHHSQRKRRTSTTTYKKEAAKSTDKRKGETASTTQSGKGKRWEAPPRHPNKGWKEAALRKEVRRSNTLPNQGTGRNNTTQRKNRKRAPLTMRDGQSNTTPIRKEKAAPAQKGGAKVKWWYPLLLLCAAVFHPLLWVVLPSPHSFKNAMNSIYH